MLVQSANDRKHPEICIHSGRGFCNHQTRPKLPETTWRSSGKEKMKNLFNTANEQLSWYNFKGSNQVSCMEYVKTQKGDCP